MNLSQAKRRLPPIPQEIRGRRGLVAQQGTGHEVVVLPLLMACTRATGSHASRRGIPGSSLIILIPGIYNSAPFVSRRRVARARGTTGGGGMRNARICADGNRESSSLAG
jgi:hypothetical protein